MSIPIAISLVRPPAATWSEVIDPIPRGPNRCTKLPKRDLGDTNQEVETCALIVPEPELGSSSEEIAHDGSLQYHVGRLLTEGPRSRRYVMPGIRPPKLRDGESSYLMTK